MPGINSGIGRRVDQDAGVSWSSYWTHQSEVLFFGLYSEISGGQMPNKVTGATDFLTVAGVAGSETYQCPNTAPYQTADTDYIWFKTDVSQRTTTTAELIGYDFTRTIIKYANAAPYAIEAIMILSSDVDTAKMRDDFDLSIWWSNVLSAYGNVKENRGVGQSVWSLIPIIPTGLTLTGISGGVKIDWTDTNNGSAETEIWGQSDGAEYVLLYTVNGDIITQNDIVAPVDLRYYRIRTLKDVNYSEYTDPVSIALLGEDRVLNGTFTDASNWTPGVNFSIADGLLKAVLVAKWAYTVQSGAERLTVGATYRTVFTVSDASGTCAIKLGTTYGTNRSTGTHVQDVVCIGHGTVYIVCTSTNGSFNVDNVIVKQILYP